MDAKVAAFLTRRNAKAQQPIAPRSELPLSLPPSPPASPPNEQASGGFLMMNANTHVQQYESEARGRPHANDGHLEKEAGKLWDKGTIVWYALDADNDGMGVIAALNSKRRYVVLTTPQDQPLSSIDIQNAEANQVYKFEPHFNAEAEMWYANNIRFEQDSDDYEDADEDAIGGVVTHYNTERGFGFIEPDDSGATPSTDEYFFHVSAVEDGQIEDGDLVYFYESWDENKERYHATDIIIANDE